MRNFSIKDLKITQKGHELDEMASYIINEKKVVLIGNNNEIEAFIKENKGMKIYAAVVLNNVEIEPLSMISKEEVVLEAEQYNVVSVTWERTVYEAMEKEFLDTGKFFVNKNFFQGEVFQSIWWVYKEDKISIDRIEIFLTSHCTLNCEKCIAFIPYFKKRMQTPFEKLKSDADILFSKVDYVKKLKLLGGEGFAYTHLVEYIEYLYENYGDKLGEVRVGTNGTLFPKQEVLDCCRRNNVIVDVSDYTNAVPEKCRLQEVVQLLEKENVKYDIKRVGEQWLDMGFPEDIPPKKTQMELCEQYSKCAMFCRDFYDGKLWYCCSNFAAVCAGLFPENENDYFDFRRDFSKKELLEFELGFSELGHTTFCEKCYGGSEEANPRHVEVAKQI